MPIYHPKAPMSKIVNKLNNVTGCYPQDIAHSYCMLTKNIQLMFPLKPAKYITKTYLVEANKKDQNV